MATASMTTAAFLGLQATGEGRWRLPVSETITGGARGALFGGAGLAAGVAVLTETTDQPPVWATCQFLSAAPLGSVIELTAATPAIGRTVTQAQVTGTVDGDLSLTIVGANGRRPPLPDAARPVVPEAGDPDEAEPVIRKATEQDAIHAHVDCRMARGFFGFVGTGTPTGDEETLLWMRMKDADLDAAALAVMSDYLSSAVGNALGSRTYGISLDNTIRYGWPIDDEAIGDGWVLCQSQIEFVGNGFAHGTGLLWSRSGQLLATVSQSMITFPVS